MKNSSLRSIHFSRIATKYSILILIAVFSGYWIIKIAGLPTKWTLALFGMTLFVFLIWVSKNVEKVTLFFFLLAIPLNLDVNFMRVEGHYGGMNSLSVGLIDIFLVLLFLSWVARVFLQKNKIEWHPMISLPLTSMATIAGFSAAGAPDPNLSIFEIVLIAKGLLIFLYLSNNLSKEIDLRLVLLCLALGACIQSIFGLLQYFSNSPLGLGILGESGVLFEQELGGELSPRIGGTIGHPNDFAKYISFIFPLILSALFIPLRAFERVFYPAMLGVIFLAVVLALSRVAWVGVTFSSFVVYILHRKQRHIRTYYQLIGLFLVLFIATIQLDIIRQRFTSYDNEAAYSRITTTRVALKMIVDHPLTGIGTNNYDVVVQEYADPRHPWTFTAPVHNMYLLQLAETGLIGFIVFIWLQINILRTLIQRCHQWSYFSMAFRIGCIAAFCAVLLQGFVDLGLKNNQPKFILFWVVIACIVALHTSSMTKKQRETSFSKYS